jgi:hypothetical protein
MIDIRFIVVIALTLLVLLDRQYIGPCLKTCYQKLDTGFLVLIFALGIYLGYSLPRNNKSNSEILN